MDSEVTIVVTRVHWHCSSCQVVNKHVVSIDQHLQSCHLDLISVATTSSPCPSPDLEMDDFSEDFTEGDLEFWKESDEKRSQGELPEMTPSSAADMSEETAQSGKNETTTGTSSQSKSETRNLFSEDRSGTFGTSQQKDRERGLSGEKGLSKIPVNMSKPTENTPSKNDVRTGNLSNSSGDMPESDPQQNVYSSHMYKSRHSVRLLTKDRKENQRHPDNASVRSPAEANSGKAEEQLKQEHRPRRKRQRLQSNSCNEDAQKEQMCNTHSDKSKVEDTGISQRNLKFPGVQTAMDREESAPKKARNDHPKSSEEPKEDLRKRRKTAGRQSEKYGFAGKLARKPLTTRKEMKRLILSYVGNMQSKKVNDTIASTHMPPSEVNTNRQTAIENVHIVTDSDAVESNLQHPTSDETLASVAGTSLSAVHGRHTDVTEACGTTETSKVNTPDLPGETCNSQSSIDVVSQTPSVVCENLCPPRQCTSASDAETPLTASTCHDLPDTDMSKVQIIEHSLTDIPQTDSVCSQQDVGQVSKTMKEEPCNFQNDGKSSETEERRTNYSVSKEKAVTSFEQPSNLYECTICLAKFSTGENLSNHVLKMSDFEPLECQNCRRHFHSVYDLNFHVFEDHEKRSEPFCFDCGEKFQNMATFEIHLHHHKYNSEPKLLEMGYHLCTICQLAIPCRFESLRNHYNKHKKSICCECFVRSELVLFQDAVSLREHKTVHSNFCTVCFQDFTSAETLNDHYPCQSEFMNQEDGQGAVCGKCSQWCPNKALVNVHHKEHKLQMMRKPNPSPRLPCVYCDRTLYGRRGLIRHIRLKHCSSRIYTFHCEFCGKGVDTKQHLQNHIATHHDGIKRYGCEYCDQRFVCASTLKYHTLKEHTIDQQYKCEECGDRFCGKERLARHMYIHTGSARFMCELCGKGFHKTSDFKRHKKTHEEKRSFVCPQCGLTYKRKNHLTRHIRLKSCVSGEKPLADTESVTLSYQ